MQVSAFSNDFFLLSTLLNRKSLKLIPVNDSENKVHVSGYIVMLQRYTLLCMGYWLVYVHNVGTVKCFYLFMSQLKVADLYIYT